MSIFIMIFYFSHIEIQEIFNLSFFMIIFLIHMRNLSFSFYTFYLYSILVKVISFSLNHHKINFTNFIDGKIFVQFDTHLAIKFMSLV